MSELLPDSIIFYKKLKKWLRFAEGCVIIETQKGNKKTALRKAASLGLTNPAKVLKMKRYCEFWQNKKTPITFIGATTLIKVLASSRHDEYLKDTWKFLLER